MFLKESKRFKDGKEHHYWSLVENRRVDGGRKVVQRHVLYLGEINSSQQAAWRKTIEVFETGSTRARTVALFAEERSPAVDDDNIVRIRLDQLELRRPRQWGACWLANVLYQKLGLDNFWSEQLPASRKGTRWDHVLQTLVSYRLIDPGSEWRLHREWFDKSALADLLGADYRLAADDTLYRCLDQLTEHKGALFSHLQERWKDLFAARFDVLLYDLTSTYFESDPPFAEGDKRRFGYSRDKRFDCVQVVIALVVTPEGFPLGYEVLPGNTLDKQTLISALASIRDDLLMKLGAARQQWPSAWRLVALRIPKKDEAINEQTFTWRLRKARLRQVRRREGRYLLRTNLTEEDPVKLWEYYIQLTQVEEAFKNLKGDLSLRPVYHQREDRIEAHLFVSFLAYCLHVTLRRWLRDLAPGLTPRSVLEKFAAVQMIDVHLPTTDGRHVILPRYTQPEKELQVLLDQMKLTLPEQPPPRITTSGKLVE